MSGYRPLHREPLPADQAPKFFHPARLADSPIRNSMVLRHPAAGSQDHDEDEEAEREGSATGQAAHRGAAGQDRDQRLHAGRGRRRDQKGARACQTIQARSRRVPMAREAFGSRSRADIRAERIEAVTGHRIEPWQGHRQTRRATDRRAPRLDLPAHRRGGERADRGRDRQREVGQVVREPDEEAGKI